MPCPERAPIYFEHATEGLRLAAGNSDGNSISLTWTVAYPDSLGFKIAYNIYFSSLQEHVFSENVKYIFTGKPTPTDILNLTPGDTYFFAVRATEYDPTIMDLSLLPDAGTTKFYPEGLLLAPMTTTSTSIEMTDVDLFPAFGVVQVGDELIRYTNVDLVDSSLTGLTRGLYGTVIHAHQIDGYDGYEAEDPIIRYWKGFEEHNTAICSEICHFVYPNYAYTLADGYKMQTQDMLTTNLTASDESQTGFAPYDFSGYTRDHPADILAGNCIGTYFGGEVGCVDGYRGAVQTRGVPIQVVNDQREEVLLQTTGERCILVKRMWTGIRCSCFLAETEYPEERCRSCYGSGFVTGYEQFFDTRTNTRRILVRFEPTEDDLVMQDAGLESTFPASAWTLSVPAIKDRDFIIRFNQDGTEEFRYEVLSVTRNKIFNDFYGRQQLKLQRVRKTDPIAHWRASKTIGMMPSMATTTIGASAGIPPHVHQVYINETILSLSAINGTTTIAFGHDHGISGGIVDPEGLGHNHIILFP